MLLDPSGEPNTLLKGMAAAVDVSVPTLRHYFGDRDGIHAAVLQAVRAHSAVYHDLMADPGDAQPSVLLPDLLVDTVHVWRRYGLDRLFASGLALGLEHDNRGPSFVNELLEPLLQAVERMFAQLIERDRLPRVDPRAAALTLLAPVVLALLHQDNLGGARCRPLDVEAYARSHARVVLHGLEASGESATAADSDRRRG